MTKEEKQERIRVLQELLDSEGWKIVDSYIKDRVELLAEQILQPLKDPEGFGEELTLQTRRITRQTLLEVLNFPVEVRTKLIDELEKKPIDLSVY